jgi:hypothetical protein
MTNKTNAVSNAFNTSELATMFAPMLNNLSTGIKESLTNATTYTAAALDTATKQKVFNCDSMTQEILNLLLVDSSLNINKGELNTQLSAIVSKLINKAYKPLLACTDDKQLGKLAEASAAMLAPLAQANNLYCQVNGLDIKTENFNQSLRVQIIQKCNLVLEENEGCNIKFNLSTSGKKGAKVSVIKIVIKAAKVEKTQDELLELQALALHELFISCEVDVLKLFAEKLLVNGKNQFDIVNTHINSQTAKSSVNHAANIKKELEILANKENSLIDSIDDLTADELALTEVINALNIELIEATQAAVITAKAVKSVKKSGNMEAITLAGETNFKASKLVSELKTQIHQLDLKLKQLAVNLKSDNAALAANIALNVKLVKEYATLKAA